MKAFFDWALDDSEETVIVRELVVGTKLLECRLCSKDKTMIDADERKGCVLVSVLLKQNLVLNHCNKKSHA